LVVLLFNLEGRDDTFLSHVDFFLNYTHYNSYDHDAWHPYGAPKTHGEPYMKTESEIKNSFVDVVLFLSVYVVGRDAK
jgi:hypothetical protein